MDELTNLGFDTVLCGASLRESGGSVPRAADWLLGLTVVPSSGEMDDATVARVRRTVKALEGGGLGLGALCDALDALHAYCGNFLHSPGKARFARINTQNAAFAKRVGELPPAVAVLVAAGWELREGAWVFGSRDLAGLWAVKALVAEAFARLFM